MATANPHYYRFIAVLVQTPDEERVNRETSCAIITARHDLANAKLAHFQFGHSYVTFEDELARSGPNSAC